MTTTAARPATLRLSARMNAALNSHARTAGISKDSLARRAISGLLEDLEDIKAIKERRGEKAQSWEDVKAELGL